MRLFPLLRLYSADRTQIQEQFEVGALFDLVNTVQKILIMDRSQIIHTLRSMCIEYRRKSSKRHKIRKTYFVLAKIIRNSQKSYGKRSLLLHCMELLSPPMNTVVRGAFSQYLTWRQRHANRKIITYEN